MSKSNYKYLYNASKHLRNKLKTKIPYLVYEKAMKKFIAKEYKTNLQEKYEKLKKEDELDAEDEFSIGINKSIKLLKLHNLIIDKKYRTDKLFDYNLMFSDKEILEDLFKSLTTYSINLMPKIKAVIKYRVYKHKEKNFEFNEYENDLPNDVFEEILHCFTDTDFLKNSDILFDCEIEILDELESIGFIVEHFIKNTMIEDSFIKYLSIMRDNVNFFTDLIDKIDIKLQYIKCSYKELFNNYFNYPTTPLMYLVQLSLYYEYLLLSDQIQIENNTEIDNEKIKCIKSISLNSGPLVTKVLQKLACINELDISKRSILSVCYGNLQKLIDSEIDAIKIYLLNPNHLDTTQNDKYIKENLKLENPLNVASVGQVNIVEFNDKSYILKFVKPRTFLHIIAEIFLVKDVIYSNIEKSDNDQYFNKKKVDYLKYIIMHMLYEFNFDKEKINLLQGKKNYEEMNISTVSLPEIEPFHLYNIPHIWMDKIEGVSLSSIINNNDFKRCIKLIPEIKKLIFVWTYNVLFKDGFFHADLHPGNIIVDKNNKIHIIDFGNCFVLSEKEKKHLIKSIKSHIKLVALLDKKYIFDFKQIFRNPFKIIRKITKDDYIYYVKETYQHILGIVDISVDDETSKELVEKILEFLLDKNKWNTCFGSFCECLLNNANDIGTFSGSKVMEFTKGIYILEKTWNSLLCCCNQEKSFWSRDNIKEYKFKENPKVIEVAFNEIYKLNIIKKIKLFFSFIWK